jgi:hypothetical protein
MLISGVKVVQAAPNCSRVDIIHKNNLSNFGGRVA